MLDRRLFACRLSALRREGCITSTTLIVGQELLTYADRAGVCWPAHATLAFRVGCCVRSVQRALADLRRVGLLSWRERRARWNRRLSNVYSLLGPSRLPDAQRKEPTRVLPDKMSDGSPALLAALARLGAVMGVDPSRVMPWLSAPPSPGGVWPLPREAG